MKFKSFLTVIILSLAVFIAGCSSSESSGDEKSTVVKVGTSSAETPTWNLIKNIAKEQGIEIEIVKIDDYVQPNLALDNGEIDINAFQTIVYLDQFKSDRNLDITAIGTTNIWPMGIYSKKITAIDELKDGDQIILPKDPTNLGRALKLLEKAGIITLIDDFNNAGGLENVKDNPKNLTLTPVDAAQTARGLDDATASLINSNHAIQAGLNPTNDSIFREDAENKSYINVIAAQTDRKDDEVLQKIVEIYHSSEVTEFIKKEFNGAAVPVIEPISYLDGYADNK